MNVHRKKKIRELRNERKEEQPLRNTLSLREFILCVYKVSVRDKNLFVNPLSEYCKESFILYQTFVYESQECLSDKIILRCSLIQGESKGCARSRLESTCKP